MYAERLNGKRELFELEADPWQVNNIVNMPDMNEVLAQMQLLLRNHQAQRHDELVPCTDWKNWLDEQRRVVRNARGELSHPETLPDWSLLS